MIGKFLQRQIHRQPAWGATHSTSSEIKNKITTAENKVDSCGYKHTKNCWRIVMQIYNKMRYSDRAEFADGGKAFNT